MLLIGEKLNSSIPSSAQMLSARDTAAVTAVIDAQLEGGADYIDINTALTNDELGNMLWAAQLVKARGGRVMPDSPNESVLIRAMESIEGDIMLNSVRLDAGDDFISAIARRKAAVIAMPLNGPVPQTAGERLSNAKQLCARLTAAGVDKNRIYCDILAEAAALADAPALPLETLCAYKQAGLNAVCGLSNISFGLPQRLCVNEAFAAMAAYNGIDAIICNLISPQMRLFLAAARLLCGQDEMGIDYIACFRQNKPQL